MFQHSVQSMTSNPKNKRRNRSLYLNSLEAKLLLLGLPVNENWEICVNTHPSIHLVHLFQDPFAFIIHCINSQSTWIITPKQIRYHYLPEWPRPIGINSCSCLILMSWRQSLIRKLMVGDFASRPSPTQLEDKRLEETKKCQNKNLGHWRFKLLKGLSWWPRFIGNSLKLLSQQPSNGTIINSKLSITFSQTEEYSKLYIILLHSWDFSLVGNHSLN